MSERNWSTKTLARQLVSYLKMTDLAPTSTLVELLATLKNSVVEEEVGISLDPWDGE